MLPSQQMVIPVENLGFDFQMGLMTWVAGTDSVGGEEDFYLFCKSIDISIKVIVGIPLAAPRTSPLGTREHKRVLWSSRG